MTPTTVQHILEQGTALHGSTVRLFATVDVVNRRNLSVDLLCSDIPDGPLLRCLVGCGRGCFQLAEQQAEPGWRLELTGRFQVHDSSSPPVLNVTALRRVTDKEFEAEPSVRDLLAQAEGVEHVNWRYRKTT